MTAQLYQRYADGIITAGALAVAAMTDPANDTTAALSWTRRVARTYSGDPVDGEVIVAGQMSAVAVADHLLNINHPDGVPVAEAARALLRRTRGASDEDARSQARLLASTLVDHAVTDPVAVYCQKLITALTRTGGNEFVAAHGHLARAYGDVRVDQGHHLWIAWCQVIGPAVLRARAETDRLSKLIARPMAAQDPKWHDKQDIARWAGISRSTLDRWIDNNGA